MAVTPHDEHGVRLLTSDEAAALAGILPQSWFVAVARGSAPPADGHVGRTPVWRETTVTGWLARRQSA